MHDARSPHSLQRRFAADVIAGLEHTPRVIPARYLYDATGSRLFEEITRLPAYYLTRAEIAVLERHGAEIAEAAGRGRAVVEFGSGSSTKTPLLLRYAAPAAYVPIEISEEFLAASCQTLEAKLDGIRIMPVAGDFTRPLVLARELASTPKVGFFPGSTVGNFTPRAAVDLLRSFRRMLGEDARLVIGFDTCQDRRRVQPAYDDDEGVTASFNKNLLTRINRELDGNIPVEAFTHRAIWRAALGRIEMHLVARRDIAFTVCGRQFGLRAGEGIHTENSYKYRPAEIAMLARTSGWQPMEVWSDDASGFGVNLWSAAPEALEP
jgi:dimethylhistidine N-methyltransferase